MLCNCMCQSVLVPTATAREHGDVEIVNYLGAADCAQTKKQNLQYPSVILFNVARLFCSMHVPMTTIYGKIYSYMRCDCFTVVDVNCVTWKAAVCMHGHRAFEIAQLEPLHHADDFIVFGIAVVLTYSNILRSLLGTLQTVLGHKSKQTIPDDIAIICLPPLCFWISVAM